MTTVVASRWRGDDFPAWLSPMLVKELRQGVQSGAFAWTFVGLQAVMFLVTATALASGAVDAGSGEAAAMFWVPVTLAVAVVVPLRGLGAIASERAGNNLDLVRLTHLSATRIVVGKWLAIVAQSALLAVAVLPYLVLRYFFGGVNVIRDLASLGWMLAAAGLVAAAAVAASTRPVRERIGLVILLAVVGNVLLQAAFFAFGGGGATRWLTSGFGLVFVGLYTALCLEHAAAAIAPPAENHAAMKRGICLALAAAWIALGLAGPRDWFWITVACTIVPLVAVAVEALCEQPSRLLAVHAPFARCGAAGRLAALGLAPGWATGLAFVTVVGMACAGGVAAWARRFDPLDMDEVACVVMLVFATVVFPLPAVVALVRTRWRFPAYAAVQVGCVFVLIVDSLLGIQAGFAGGERPVATVALFPLAALVRVLDVGPRAHVTLGFAAAFVTVVVYVLVAAPWLREMATTRKLLAAASARGTGGDAGRSA